MYLVNYLLSRNVLPFVYPKHYKKMTNIVSEKNTTAYRLLYHVKKCLVHGIGNQAKMLRFNNHKSEVTSVIITKTQI